MITRTLSAVLAALCSAGLVCAGSMPANAALDERPITRTSPSEFESQLVTLTQKVPEAGITLRKFRELSPIKQQQFIAIVLDADSLSSPEVEIRSEVVATQPRKELVSPSALMYRTSTWRYSLYAFDIKIGYFSQTARYTGQSYGNTVRSIQSCAGTFTGLAGFWSMDKSTTHFIFNKRGYCVTDFDMSLVYKGSAVAATKRMTMVFDAWGIERKSLIDV